MVKTYLHLPCIKLGILILRFNVCTTKPAILLVLIKMSCHTAESPIKDIEIKHLLKNALTDKIDEREIFMKGIDVSY